MWYTYTVWRTFSVWPFPCTAGPRAVSSTEHLSNSSCSFSSWPNEQLCSYSTISKTHKSRTHQFWKKLKMSRPQEKKRHRIYSFQPQDFFVSPPPPVYVSLCSALTVTMTKRPCDCVLVCVCVCECVAQRQKEKRLALKGAWFSNIMVFSILTKSNPPTCFRE